MRIPNRFQYYSDKMKPQFRYRWMVTFVLACFHAIRVYLHGYYFLNLMLGMLVSVSVGVFMTSRIDRNDPDLPVPSGALPLLPIKSSDKLRPFVPLLSEFSFWCIVNIFLCVALGMTFIPSFNVPGPWYLYFGGWLLIISHLSVTHKYLPFYYGDKKNGEYKGK